MEVKDLAAHEAEFNKGWETEGEKTPVESTEQQAVSTEQESPEASESAEKPAEETQETVVEADKPAEESAEVKVETDDKAKPVKKEKLVEDDENSASFKQRWKSQQGIVKSEMARRTAAEQKLAEKDAEIARIKAEYESKLATTEKEKVDTKTSDAIDDLEEKYMDAVLQEDKTSAKQIRKQIDDLKFKQFYESLKQETDQKLTTAITHQSLNDKIEQFVADVAQQYPFLDHTNEKTMDEDAILLVQARRNKYMAEMGLNKLDAMIMAVEDVAPRFVRKAQSSTTPSKQEIQKQAENTDIQSTVAVDTNSTPVKIAGDKKKLPQTYDEGWDSA